MKEKILHNKRIRKGDKVMVITGNDTGLVGEVLSRSDDRVTVRGVNVRKKHVKRSQQNPSGGIIEIERPIHISNVTLCVDEEKPRKLKVGYDAAGQRLLVYREGDTDVPFRPIRNRCAL
jgi:large subunit ribosomal protein L24